MPLSTHTVPRFRAVPWFSQFYWCFRKNYWILSRRPVMLSFVLLSSVLSMLLSWGTGGRDPPAKDVLYPPEDAVTDCGTVRLEYYLSLSYQEQEKLQFTLNDEWSNGSQVAFMGLGALCHAMFAFLVVNAEFTGELLGVLRALGLRDSVYWLSWYTAFGITSCINAFLGAFTAKMLPGNVYENVFFGGIYASLLFLNLSLVAASFVLAAVCGTSRRLCTNFVLLTMILLAFVPFMVSALTSWRWGFNFTSAPSGLFWEYSSTETLATYLVNTTDDNQLQNYTCHTPILNEFQGTWFKTEEERETVGADEIFIGW
jgi:hypothetical protein